MPEDWLKEFRAVAVLLNNPVNGCYKLIQGHPAEVKFQRLPKTGKIE